MGAWYLGAGGAQDFVNGADGAAVGSVPIAVTTMGPAPVLTGIDTNYIAVPQASVPWFTTLSAFTGSIWMAWNGTRQAGPDDWGTPFANGDFLGGVFSIIINKATGGGAADVRFYNNGTELAVYSWPVPDTLWHNWTFTADVSSSTIYQDGIAVATGSGWTVDNDPRDLQFGLQLDGTFPVEGNLAWPVIYNRQITINEVGELVAAPYSFLRPVVRRSYGIGQSAFIATLSDTAATSDILSFSGLGLTLSDSAATSDAITTPLMQAAATLADVEGGDPFSSDFSSDFGGSALSDAYVVTALGETIGDTAATSDSLSGLRTTSASYGDSAVTSDLLTPSVSLTLADTAATSDSLTSGGMAATGSLSETANATDTLTGVPALAGILNDTVTTSDSLTLTATSYALNDTLATSDTLLPTAVNGTLADTVTTSDSLTATGHGAATVSDTLTTSESLTGVGHGAATISETAATSDVVVLAAISLSLSDSVTTSDSVTYTITTALSDSTATSDSLTGAGAATATLSDTEVTVDALTKTGNASYVLADTVVSTESLTGILAIVPVSLSDSTATSDTYTPVSFVNNWAATAATSDSLTATATGSFALSDTAATSDAFQIAGAVLTIADFIASSEILLGAGHGTATVSDSAATSENYSFIKGFSASLSDSAATTDNIIFIAYGFGFVLNDTLVISEAYSSQGTSANLVMTATIIPTGGAVLLQFPSFRALLTTPATITISRSIAGTNIWTTIYAGPPVEAFLDVGDGTPLPLNPAIEYFWRLTGGASAVIAGPLMPSSSFLNQPDQLTDILIRALQGAINTMVLPPGIKHTQVTTKMPMNGWTAMPFIVVNLDLIQQTETEIGEDVINPTNDNNWTLFANAKRVWRVTIMSQDVDERDFYRDTLLSVFRVLLATAFAPLGLNVQHSFSASSYPSAQEWDGQIPGFYAADLMFELDGIFPAAVVTNYPVILAVESDPTFTPYTFTVEIP